MVDTIPKGSPSADLVVTTALLELSTDCGSCGSLCLLLGTDATGDHASELPRNSAVLVALGVSSLEPILLLSFGIVTLCSLPSNLSIFKLSISQRASSKRISNSFFSNWSASHSIDTLSICCCFSCTSRSYMPSLYLRAFEHYLCLEEPMR